jgi:hypothetical protein
MRSRRSLWVGGIGVLLVVGIVWFAWPSLERYTLSRHIDRVVLQATAPGGSGVADFGQLDLFAWDRLHIFRPYTSHATLDAALGFPWGDKGAVQIEQRDDINLFVFTRGRFVVAYLELPRSRLDVVGISEHQAFAPSAAQFHTHTESGAQVVLLTPIAP